MLCLGLLLSHMQQVSVSLLTAPGMHPLTSSQQTKHALHLTRGHFPALRAC